MGHKYTREQILAGALEAAFDEGLSKITFGRLSKRLGISDRVIVYYFPTKDALIGEIIVAMATELQTKLAAAFPAKSAGHRELLGVAWPVVATAETDRVFAVFFEANGLAATGQEPYASLLVPLVEGWIAWTEAFIDAPPSKRRAEAEAAVAMLDGLLLIRQLAGPAAAQRAAGVFGITETASPTD